MKDVVAQPMKPLRHNVSRLFSASPSGSPAAATTSARVAESSVSRTSSTRHSASVTVLNNDVDIVHPLLA